MVLVGQLLLQKAYLCLRRQQVLQVCAIRVQIPEAFPGFHLLEHHGFQPIDHQRAEQWAAKMQNADGSMGPHWSMEQTEQVRTQQNIDCEPIKFWVAMNMMYSDYCKVAEKLGVNNAIFYACMAKAFLDDKDAQPENLGRYYEYIVRH